MNSPKMYEPLTSGLWALPQKSISNMIAFGVEKLHATNWKPRTGISQTTGNVCTIMISGVLFNEINTLMEESHSEGFGSVGTSLMEVKSCLQSAISNDSVKKIVLQFKHTSGGSLAGAEEIADMIFNARSSKKIVSFIDNTNGDGYCLGASYLIASAAEHLYVDKGATVGLTEIVKCVYDENGIQFVSSAGPLENQSLIIEKSDVDNKSISIEGKIQIYRNISSEKIKTLKANDKISSDEAIKMNLVDGISDLKSILTDKDLFTANPDFKEVRSFEPPIQKAAQPAKAPQVASVSPDVGYCIYIEKDTGEFLPYCSPEIANSPELAVKLFQAQILGYSRKESANISPAVFQAMFETYAFEIGGITGKVKAEKMTDDEVIDSAKNQCNNPIFRDVHTVYNIEIDRVFRNLEAKKKGTQDFVFSGPRTAAEIEVDDVFSSLNQQRLTKRTDRKK